MSCSSGAPEARQSAAPTAPGRSGSTNPIGNPPLTLVDDFVDIGPCHFAPWVSFLPVTALTIVDDADPNSELDEVLSTGGRHVFACSGVDSFTQRTEVPTVDITRSP